MTKAKAKKLDPVRLKEVADQIAEFGENPTHPDLINRLTQEEGLKTTKPSKKQPQWTARMHGINAAGFSLGNALTNWANRARREALQAG